MTALTRYLSTQRPTASSAFGSAEIVHYPIQPNVNANTAGYVIAYWACLSHLFTHRFFPSKINSRRSVVAAT